MPIYYSKGHELFTWYKDDSIKKYRPIISREIVEKYGKGPYSVSETVEILFYTLDWYENQFLSILQSENELTFFQGLFLLHEFSCKIHQEKNKETYIEIMNEKEFAVYRRILKLCLEQACDIDLVATIDSSPEYLKSKEQQIDNLMYLGDFIYNCSNLLAAQDLIEDCIELKWNNDDLFYFDFKHHYGYIINQLSNTYEAHIEEAVVGKEDFSDFVEALKNCLGVDYTFVTSSIQAIHNHFEAGKFALDEWMIYPKNLEGLYGIPYEKGEIFFKGLTLDRHNKMSIKEAVYKLHNLNKYLYRPFLVWNVEGKDLTFVGDKMFIESIHSLCTNAFGWNKYPVEWDNPCFKKYILSKVSKNDKILEDRAETILKNNNVVYDRNVKHLKKWNHQNLNIDNELCGEIDFLIMFQDKIYIADSRHQLARYDMTNFKHDFAYFEKNKKAYNKTLRRKLDYLNNIRDEVQEHFQVITNDKSMNIDKIDLEGIFIINTPTFIMYNNTYRIYTLKTFRELMEGTFIDQEYNLFIDEEDHQKYLRISYPYFQKPNYKVFDLSQYEDDEL